MNGAFGSDEKRRPPDRAFERLWVLAHCRWIWLEAAENCAAELEADRIALTQEALKSALLLLVYNTDPKSIFRPIGVSDDDAHNLLDQAVADFFSRVRP